MDPTLCTHIIYAFMNDNSGNLITGQSVTDFIGMKSRNPNVKLIAAFGGASFSRASFTAVS